MFFFKISLMIINIYSFMKNFSLFLESKKKYNIRTIEYNGYTIIYGRDAISNDYLSTDGSHPNDLWFHTTDGIPSSHLIIKNKNDEQIPIDVIEKAAEITALNSKAKGASGTKVVYCKRKYVSKLPEHKVGQVRVEHTKANYIVIR